MGFQFEPWPNPQVAEVAYAFPPLPAGVSYGLRKLIDRYTECVKDGVDDSEDEVFSEICIFPPNHLPDVIAKTLITIHFDHPGLDGDQLVLVEGTGKRDLDGLPHSILRDLYSQVPKSWGEALNAYRAAVSAEHDYDRRLWRPAYDASEAGGPPIPPAVDAEMERLQDARCFAEAVVTDMPAPSLAEFAIKYLIGFDSDRDMNGLHEGLCAEAKRLLNIGSADDALELDVLLRTLDRRPS